jgi:hypothetical protein
MKVPKPTECILCEDGWASFGFRNDIAVYCYDCYKNELPSEGKSKYVNYRKKVCERCSLKASFNFPDKTGVRRCSIHKKDGMINKEAKRCKCGKSTGPCYGIISDKNAKYCSYCKEEGMVDIKNPKCVCGTLHPAFNFPNKKKGKYCSKCKEEGMIDFIRKRCKCKKVSYPMFGFPNDKKATCCTECKEEGMIDIKNKRCFCKKSTRPIYANEDEKVPTHCAKCKEEDMINVYTKKCEANEPPYSYYCPTSANKYYNNFCAHCFVHLFPDHPKTSNYRKKSKELTVVNYISTKIDGFYHDRPLYVNLKGGCCPSRRRIDLRKLIGNTLLCIEIDERQHRGYCKQDEESRYNELFMDFSGKYIFIRFNPDKYKKNKKNKNPLLKSRLPILLQAVNNHIKRINNEENEDLLEIHHMFYDVY